MLQSQRARAASRPAMPRRATPRRARRGRRGRGRASVVRNVVGEHREGVKNAERVELVRADFLVGSNSSAPVYGHAHHVCPQHCYSSPLINSASMSLTHDDMSGEKRGCAQICPNGEMRTGKGKRSVHFDSPAITTELIRPQTHPR